MAGRASCEECIEKNLADCETCPKPESLHPANEKAMQAWRIFKRIGKGSGASGLITIVASVNGTESDLEKVIEIISIDRRLNSDNEQ